MQQKSMPVTPINGIKSLRNDLFAQRPQVIRDQWLLRQRDAFNIPKYFWAFMLRITPFFQTTVIIIIF